MTPITTSRRETTVAKTGRRIERSERTTLLAGRCRRSGRDARAVAQLDGAFRDDRVAGREAGGDFHLTAPARAQPDLHAACGLVLRHAVDEGVRADLDHRDFGHDDRAARRLV